MEHGQVSHPAFCFACSCRFLLCLRGATSTRDGGSVSAVHSMLRIVLVINRRPPSLWAFNNVPVVVASALLPLMWWGTVQLLFSWLWQEVYGWTAMNVAVHLYVNIILIAVTV